MTNSPTETDIPAWVGLAAGAGILLLAVAMFGFDKPPVWLAIPAIALLGAASIGGMAHGWFVGLQPRARAAAPATSVGLVGSQVRVGGSVFTVLDDSAVAGDGRRCSVVARDAAGRVELLYVGFDRSGVVCEARVDGGDWAPASVIG